MNRVSDGIEIKRLTKDDLATAKKLIRLFHEVFKTKSTITPKKSYLEKLLAKPDFIAYVALNRNEVVGGLTAYVLPMFTSKSTEVFIYDVAVKPEFQRRGVGRKLISTLKEFCKRNRMKVIFVAANEEDIHALEFYRSTGGRGKKVVLFTYELAER